MFNYKYFTEILLKVNKYSKRWRSRSPAAPQTSPDPIAAATARNRRFDEVISFAWEVHSDKFSTSHYN